MITISDFKILLTKRFKQCTGVLNQDNRDSHASLTNEDTTGRIQNGANRRRASSTRPPPDYPTTPPRTPGGTYSQAGATGAVHGVRCTRGCPRPGRVPGSSRECRLLPSNARLRPPPAIAGLIIGTNYPHCPHQILRVVFVMLTSVQVQLTAEELSLWVGMRALGVGILGMN